MKINAATSYLLHKMIDTLIDLNNDGNDSSINICMAAGAVSVTITLYDGECEARKAPTVLHGYSNGKRGESIQSVLDKVKHRNDER